MVGGVHRTNSTPAAPIWERQIPELHLAFFGIFSDMFWIVFAVILIFCLINRVERKKWCRVAEVSRKVDGKSDFF